MRGFLDSYKALLNVIGAVQRVFGVALIAFITIAITIQVGRTDGRKTQVLGGIVAGAQELLHPPVTVKDGGAGVWRKP